MGGKLSRQLAQPPGPTLSKLVVLLLLVLPSLACIAVLAATATFLLSQTCALYSDNVAQVRSPLLHSFLYSILQVCYQVSLVSCLVSGMLTHLPLPCLLTIALILYSHLAALLFLLLESLIILHKLVDRVIIPQLERPALIAGMSRTVLCLVHWTTLYIGCGFLAPLAYTVLILPLLLLRPGLRSPRPALCALNISSPHLAALGLPAGLLSLASLAILATACSLADDSGRRPISAEVFSRAK